MDYKKYNDYELVYMVRENDDISQDILFKKYDPILRKIAGEYHSKFKSNGYEYEDFYQEALISFQRAISSYNEDRDSLLYTFINICVRRNMQSFCRNISCNKNSITLYNSFDIDDCDIKEEINNIDMTIDYMQIVDICKKVIYSLSSESAAILELRLNGFTYREIAILLDIPSSSVEFKSRRGRKLLRKYLNKYYCK